MAAAGGQCDEGPQDGLLQVSALPAARCLLATTALNEESMRCLNREHTAARAAVQLAAEQGVTVQGVRHRQLCRGGRHDGCHPRPTRHPGWPPRPRRLCAARSAHVRAAPAPPLRIAWPHGGYSLHRPWVGQRRTEAMAAVCRAPAGRRRRALACVQRKLWHRCVSHSCNTSPVFRCWSVRHSCHNDIVRLSVRHGGAAVTKPPAMRATITMIAPAVCMSAQQCMSARR